jgi:hypothetical protein
MRWPVIAGATAALGSGVTGVAPWPVTVVLSVLGAAVYVYRLRVIRDLGRQAIDKSSPNRIPEVMSTITGNDLVLNPPTGKKGAQATSWKQRAS